MKLQLSNNMLVVVVTTLLLSYNNAAEGWSMPSSSSSRSSSSSSRLMASVADDTTTTVKRTLKAPPSISDIVGGDDDETQQLYSNSVQKTYGRYPITMVSGKGCKLFSSEGKEYLDFVSGIATCALGHGNEVLTTAVSNQMKKLHHASNLYYFPEQAALATWLCENSVADKAFFCNSGAEANEAAIKLARRHASNRGITKPIIITAIDSFHGRTLAAISATGQPKYHKGFGYDGEMVQGFRYINYNNVEELEKVVAEIYSSGEEGLGLAGIMMEALQGEGGIRPGDKKFFQKARELCDQHGALLVCDEVQVGMGRTGTLWGYENLDVEPDVFTSAKALGGGVPIGAMMARGVAADVFGPGDHASTYGGNPLACSAGLAVAGYMAENDVLDNVTQRGEQLGSGLERIAAAYPSVLGPVRGWGLIRGVEAISEELTAGQIVGATMEAGLLLVPAGANVVRFVPPLIVTEQEIDAALAMFEETVKALAASQ